MLSVIPSTILKIPLLELAKRNVLKQLASIYDPLGLFSPIVLRGKLLLQSMWIKKFDWDDKTDTESSKQLVCLKSFSSILMGVLRYKI